MQKHPRDCPHPTAETPAQIDFVRQKAMIDWLHPAQLARTGLKSIVASTFGSYADKRELQAALSHLEGADDKYELTDGELWFDYTADLGDGFDPTYAVARLLRSNLIFGDEGTRRGAFVILGGDQVYPTAARDEYQNRFIGPYRAADPYEVHRVEGRFAPAMYALPGNHDWYDGLTSFLRIFCQRKGTRTGRWIGGWRTRQQRSYFALELPHDWWVWAVDSQLESDMDHPQLMYFDAMAREMRDKAGGDGSRCKIILCTAEPSWVNAPGDNAAKTCRNYAEAFNTLAHFEKTYVRANGFQLKLVLSGDLHHYVRYESLDQSGKPRTMRITAGGGGAFLLGTEQMPDVLTVKEDEPHTYVKARAYPDAAQSKQYESRIMGLPFRNRPFGALAGAIYLLFAWLLQTGSRGHTFAEGSLLGFILARHGAWADLGAFGVAFLYNPLSVAMGLVIIIGVGMLTASQAKGYRKLAKFAGFAHGLAHLVLCCALLTWISVAMAALGVRGDEITYSVTLMIALFLLGWLFGSWLLAAYLWMSTRWTGVHAGDLFSSMAITDCRNFLRMRIDAAGKLTVFAIGLQKSPDDWTFEDPGPPPEGCGKPWFHSKKFMTGDYAPHVIERIEIG